jgi:hypothetical protein
MPQPKLKNPKIQVFIGLDFLLAGRFALPVLKFLFDKRRKGIPGHAFLKTGRESNINALQKYRFCEIRKTPL